MVSVVIPNWNGEEFLEKCLLSLEKQTLAPDNVIVVDNGSQDESVAIVEHKFPDVELVKLRKNHGFAGGVNRGIEVAMLEGATYVALFNNDAVADPEWLNVLVKAMEQEEKVGIINPKMRGEDELIDSTGEEYSTWGTAFSRGRGEVDHRQYDSNDQRDIFAASGGASLYRTEMFEQVGLFDERFFAYYEDVDISFRARLAGWEVRYEPTAIVHHHIGGTSEKLGPFRQQHMLKNAALLYTKNMPSRLYWKHWPKLVLTVGMKSLNLMMNLHIWALMKAWFGIVWYTPAIVAERWKIQKNRQLSSSQVEEILYKGLSPTQKQKRLFRIFSR